MNELFLKYEEAIAQEEIVDDSLQRKVLSHLQRLFDALQCTNNAWFSFLKPKADILGIYLSGPVGAGKTYLVDLFFNMLPHSKKARFHFHHFMQQVDQQLRHLQGSKDPLKKIAKKLAKSTQVLCFDEFLVEDVATAMILADLLKALFSEGIVLVISSNTKPQDLYRNGVQRERFLPAIAAICAHCEVLHLQESRDYRLGRPHDLDAYLYPLDSKTQEKMDEQFAQMATSWQDNGQICIQNREIAYLKRAEKVIWFSFQALCNLPRSQLDYLELAEYFDTVFVSDIPRLTEQDTIAAILLIHFIDVMYDRGIYVVLSAEVPANQLYLAGEMSEPFKRTLSRLEEMQSVDYVARHVRRQVSVID